MSNKLKKKADLQKMTPEELVEFALEMQKAQLAQNDGSLADAIRKLVEIQTRQLEGNAGETSVPGDAPYIVKPWKKINNMCAIEKTLWRILNRMEVLRTKFVGHPTQEPEFNRNIRKLQNKYVRLCDKEKSIVRDDGQTFEDQYALDDAGNKAEVEFREKKTTINFSKFHAGWKKQADADRQKARQEASDFWNMPPDDIQL